MNKEYLPHHNEIARFKEIVASGNAFLLTDVDGTIKYYTSEQAPHGFDPMLPDFLRLLAGRTATKVGVCTAQTPAELDAFLSSMETESAAHPFRGPSILEDGHLVVDEGKGIFEFRQLGDPVAKVEILLLVEALSDGIIHQEPDESNPYQWGTFPGVGTPVCIPGGKYAAVATGTIWEKGPDIHDPDYRGQYEPVAAFVANEAVKLGLSKVAFIEAGNGTLRILEQGRTKATAMSELAAEGLINLGSTVYFGDGINDLEAGGLVADAGGMVVAVANAVPQFKQIASLVTKDPASHGVVEVLEQVLGI